MDYHRVYHISASHFNNRRAYDIYWDLRESLHEHDIPAGDFLYAFEEIHGHNFKIELTATGGVGKEGWLISDQELEELVMEWNNKNLSTLPEFADNKLRATTEMMAVKLKQKLADAFDDISFQVKVHETSDIYAMT